ncbi:hypothetical protein [Nocardia flavorosea]|uniref:Uncharacterized protein n=1 Tax=Nocardia flavorosea TaxID=53429 RepID=A0A846YSB3_9NOCA|nr:hypothetical protein [Nocardia flavorosea]NKY60440.1 hypothetical protein [Nocardia flavorosea]
MAATLQIWQSGKQWIDDDLRILSRLADGLRALHPYPSGHCLFTDPIRGYAHAHHVMDQHRGHGCPRWDMAVSYASVAVVP